ncbi:hypothetical protein JTE90_028241 [Oedothorax gibbosus]|uniref:Uncharacterized protein n=1 Tax=Oedothorax gibbosus TaxID=931172 RepID=A0AAV6URK2_9ARAC|nr:hypothetical protein JTE90_028241 [Oedothorax gibbosus]
MAFGGCDGLKTNMIDHKTVKDPDKILAPADSFDQSEPSDPTFDDIINDSISSSSSMSDSDLTSTDSDDSLALSESESITDVTPLNSPYCDSPLPPNRLVEDKNKARESVTPGTGPPEMNVLIKAIEKLEVETKKSEQAPSKSQRRRTVSCGVEEGLRIEQENQKLFKRVISQQSRMRAMYPSTSQPSRKNLSNNRRLEMSKDDGDAAGAHTPKTMQQLRGLKDSRKYAQRQQKCLSHPSYSFSHVSLTNNIVLPDEKSIGGLDHNTKESSLDGSSSTIISSEINAEKQLTEG